MRSHIRFVLAIAFAFVCVAARGEDTATPTTGEQVWSQLLEGNSRFVSNKPQTRDFAATREKLAAGQKPRVVIVTCSDSRVSPELIFDQNLGELFVIRIAGNVTDPISLGSIEYAVEHLHSDVLVVMGHAKCGAVTAAVARQPIASPNITAIVGKITPAVDELESTVTKTTDEEFLKQAIAANVVRSTGDILRNSEILASEAKEKKLTVISAVYDLKTGEVKRIEK